MKTSQDCKQISWEARVPVYSSRTTIPPAVRVLGKEGEVERIVADGEKGLVWVLPKLLAPFKGTWTPKRVRS